MPEAPKYVIRNPIIPGFYPDPSICRAGDDYYIANSSFELYPGIPIFHSRDLARWEQICYAMYKENGFHVSANILSGGVMAPTIRFHEGIFYIINCNFADKGNYIVTASDPAGPWSEPHWITDVSDIDCSLFFDDDGKAYLVSPGDDPSEDNGRAFFLTPYDVKNFHAAGERRKIWNSAMRKAWAPEAPHLYHIGDYYYLLTAEGGTEHNHCVMVARSRTIDGFYEGNPCNPVLTHRHLGWEYPIENIGHADLVQTPEGRWYGVCLGVRIIGGQHMNLGRETFLFPVQFERGWPVFCPGEGRVPETLTADFDILPEAGKQEICRDDFDSEKLNLCWSFWGTPYQDFWMTKEGSLVLRCLERPADRPLALLDPVHPDMSEDDNIAFIGRRQRHVSFSFRMKMRFTAYGKEEAGMMIMQASNHQYRFVQRCMDSRQVLDLFLVTTWQKGLPFLPGYESRTASELIARITAPISQDGWMVLCLEAEGQNYAFSAGPDEQHLEPVACGDGKKINPEQIGGMVGTMLGMIASANGEKSTNTAAFDWCELK